MEEAIEEFERVLACWTCYLNQQLLLSSTTLFLLVPITLSLSHKHKHNKLNNQPPSKMTIILTEGVLIANSVFYSLINLWLYNHALNINNDYVITTILIYTAAIISVTIVLYQYFTTLIRHVLLVNYFGCQLPHFERNENNPFDKPLQLLGTDLEKTDKECLVNQNTDSRSAEQRTASCSQKPKNADSVSALDLRCVFTLFQVQNCIFLIALFIFSTRCSEMLMNEPDLMTTLLVLSSAEISLISMSAFLKSYFSFSEVRSEFILVV